MTFVWIAALAAAAALAYRRHSWAGVAVMAALPLYLVRTRLFGLPTTLLEAIALGSFAGFYLRVVLDSRIIASWRENKRQALLAPTLFLLAASAMAVLVPDDRIAALGVWRAYFLEPIVALPLICVALRDSKARSAAFAILAGETVAIAAVALFQALGAIPAAGVWAAERRATGIYPYPNAVGLFLGPLVPFFAALSALGKDLDRRFRIFLGVAALAALLGSIASQTEAGIGAAIVTLAVLGVAVGGKARKATLAAVAAAAVLALAVAPIRSDLGQKLSLQDWSGTVRRVMWRETVAMLVTRPIFGAGLSGYPAAVAPFHPDPKVEIFQYPHDEFLTVWSELGAIGAIAVGWLLVAFVWTLDLGSKDRNRYLRLAAGLAVLEMAIHGLVDVPYMKNDLAFLTWFMLVLPSALSASARLDSAPKA